MLPDFLVIGAMKSATTTLYFDLRASPTIFLPEEKEPSILLRSGTPIACRESYSTLFAKSREDQLRGEFSTEYTKRPHIEVAERAAAILPPSTRIFYCIRDPVSRAISHYRHNVAAGLERRTMVDAFRQEPLYIDVSRYAYQLDPWVAAFGPTGIEFIVYEDFVADRAAILDRLATTLGIPPFSTAIDSQRVYNSTTSRQRNEGLRRTIRRSRFYQRVVRPSLTAERRERLGRLLARFGSSDVRDSPTIDPDIVQWLTTELASDARRLCRTFDLELNWPLLDP